MSKQCITMLGTQLEGGSGFKEVLQMKPAHPLLARMPRRREDCRSDSRNTQ